MRLTLLLPLAAALLAPVSASAFDLTAMTDAEREAFRETTATADFREAVSAFFEKRPPAFKGE